MSITRSITTSTLSTTGSTIYMDAESGTSDFVTPTSSINNEPHESSDHNQDLEVISNEVSEILTVGHETTHEAQLDKQSEPIASSFSSPSAAAEQNLDIREEHQNAKAAVENENTSEVQAKEDGQLEPKKDQPTATAQPTYVRQRGYQNEESECYSFFCHNNLLEVLDLSNSGIFSLLCTTCCSSCYSGGVNQARTAKL